MRKLLTLTAIVALVAAFGMTLSASPALAAGHCNVTVTAPASIQVAVNGASSGDVVCLSGTFESVPTVTISTSGITLTSASTAVLNGGDGPAFRLADGLSDVTIEDLEIRNRTGSRGGGIEAWDRTTSNITVRYNHLHNNSYNGVLVGSEGGYVHSNWMVKNNTVNNHGFAGIELTNCEDCTILDNNIDGALLGIVVQARSTSTTGVGSHNVTINGVHVLHNVVNDSGWFGIYVLSFTGHPWLFTPITGASTLLSSVSISNNTFTDSGVAGIRFWAYNDAATAKNGRIMHNDIDCPTETPGIQIMESGAGQTGTVKNVKVVNNSFDTDCNPQVIDQGDATKLPPGPFLP